MTWQIERTPRRIDDPQPGYWAMRVAKGGVEVGARIYWCDHEPGEPGNKLERPFLDAEINGVRVPPSRVWEHRGRAVNEAEYRFLVADRAWARQYKPSSPEANPEKAVDLLQAPLPF